MKILKRFLPILMSLALVFSMNSFSPLPVSAAATLPALGASNNSHAVSALQYMLVGHGFLFEEDALGELGGISENSITQQAIISFQQAEELTETGTVSTAEWDRLLITMGEFSDSNEWFIKAAQLMLTVLGFSVDETGVYDSETVTAVTDYQTDRELTVNGTVDIDTWTSLLYYASLEDVPFFHLDVSELYLDADGGEKTVTVSTNTTWSLTCDESWLSATEDEGIIHVSVEQNDSNNSRTAIVTITADGIGEQYITVLQNVTKPFVTESVKLDEENPEHWMEFTPVESGEYAIYSTGDFDTSVALYAAQDDEEYLAYDDDGGENFNFKLTYELESNVTYYYKITLFDPTMGAEFDIYIEKAALDLGIPLSVDVTYPVELESLTSANFSFTPEESGCYRFFSTSEGFQGELGWTLWSDEENDLQYAPARADGNFELICFLEADITYSAIVFFQGEDDTHGTYNIGVQRYDHPIALDISESFEITDFSYGTAEYPYSVVYSFKADETDRYVLTSFVDDSLVPDDVLVSWILCDENGTQITSGEIGGNTEISHILEKDNLYYYWIEFTNLTEANISDATFTFTLSKEPSQVFTSLILNETQTVTLDPDTTSKFFTFTPEDDGDYIIYSSGNSDTVVALYENVDDLESLGTDDDSGENHNFRLVSTLVAGKTYYYNVALWDYESTETFDIVIIKKGVTISVRTYPGGSVTGSGEYQESELVTVTAISDQGYMFDGWFENGIRIEGALEEYVFTSIEDREIWASFVLYDENSNPVNSSQVESDNPSSSEQPVESSSSSSSTQPVESDNLSSFSTLVESSQSESPGIIVMRLNSVKALLDGAEIAVDRTDETVAPFTLKGKTMVPVRFVENLGAEVKYNGATNPVTVTYGDIVLDIEFDKDTMTKTVAGGTPETIDLPTAPTMVEGKTCVPIREIAEGIGFSVKYDSHVIVVSTNQLTESEQAEFINIGKENLPAFIVGVKSITAKTPSLTAKVGDVIKLSKDDVIFTPEKVGCEKLLYSSNTNDVATVTSQGRVKIVGKGTAKITISSHNGITTAVTIIVS